jgi:hypothetical protein
MKDEEIRKEFMQVWIAILFAGIFIIVILSGMIMMQKDIELLQKEVSTLPHKYCHTETIEIDDFNATTIREFYCPLPISASMAMGLPNAEKEYTVNCISPNSTAITLTISCERPEGPIWDGPDYECKTFFTATKEVCEIR